MIGAALGVGAIVMSTCALARTVGDVLVAISEGQELIGD